MTQIRKIVAALFVTMFISSLSFAEVFKDGDKITEDFFSRGSYIKLVKDSNNISYFSKSAVSGVNIDEDDIEIFTTGGAEYEKAYSHSYNIKKWNITADSNGNIIITKKK
ncbi:MAG: hypothetical protein IKP60_07275 [Treponema sp.]|nr:hypothetical protein [Treponema sp.]